MLLACAALLLAACGADVAGAGAALRINGSTTVNPIAAEAAIGLAILVVLFRNRSTINVGDLDAMKG